ncbi:Oidioi.mRNA.OKI2018_I69.chr2.g6161.t1.cds [Oikopleura dioica]|uniref:Oidioi.mRNA.OKI2018_I69.chr2.g6161.t1.cds n=1 Tax=Oikopleura dioica TaxID=34765 RepID=A0ABN7T244_OIKDI|nr:Oidioi.mRNA.OKI2018_I69.chr2.g6161.t1.cds [Oikopleura dioica]
MTENYGQLLYYIPKKKIEDPFTGYKVVMRLATHPLEGEICFTVPEDKLPIKLDRCMFHYQMEMPSNFVPDNDVAAKMVNKFEVKILDSTIFSSFTDGLEYAFFNHFIKKLNFSPKAQEIEMFVEGHFDAFDVDSDELETKRVKHNGKTLVENRQQYAEKNWKPEPDTIKLSTDGSALSYDVLCSARESFTSRVKGLFLGQSKRC